MPVPPRPAACAAAAVLLLGALACAGPSERWAEVRFQDLSFTSLYTVVVDLLDAEGFDVRSRDPDTGTIESSWLYGTSRREVRGPSRRKALVRIEPGPNDSWIVRVRVAEEVVRKAGLLATRVRESDDWEAIGDNFEDAEYLAAKMRALLIDKQVPVAVVPAADGDSP